MAKSGTNERLIGIELKLKKASLFWIRAWLYVIYFHGISDPFKIGFRLSFARAKREAALTRANDTSQDPSLLLRSSVSVVGKSTEHNYGSIKFYNPRYANVRLLLFVVKNQLSFRQFRAWQIFIEVSVSILLTRILISYCSLQLRPAGGSRLNRLTIIY